MRLRRLARRAAASRSSRVSCGGDRVGADVGAFAACAALEGDGSGAPVGPSSVPVSRRLLSRSSVLSSAVVMVLERPVSPVWLTVWPYVRRPNGLPACHPAPCRRTSWCRDSASVPRAQVTVTACAGIRPMVQAFGHGCCRRWSRPAGSRRKPQACGVFRSSVMVRIGSKDRG